MCGICVWEHILSQNFYRMYVYSIHTFWYIDIPDVTASYGVPIDFIAFFRVFSYIFADNSLQNCCISTKLSLFVYLINTDMFKCQMWLKVTFCIFASFVQHWRIFMSEVIYLHQTFIYCIFDVNINIPLL